MIDQQSIDDIFERAYDEFERANPGDDNAPLSLGVRKLLGNMLAAHLKKLLKQLEKGKLIVPGSDESTRLSIAGSVSGSNFPRSR